MIGIILTTRGLLFTEVADAIERERKGHDVKVFYSWDKTIPLAQNALVEEALQDSSIDLLWFIEEDTVPPVGALQKLIDADADIAFIDYGVNGWSCSAKDKDGNILWCGLGCTLVKRHVLTDMLYPWFRTDKSLRLNDMSWIDTNPNKVYGQQDIWFCVNARKSGHQITQVDGECRHLKLVELGQPEVNLGLHIVEQKPKINKLQTIKGV